MDFPLLIAGRLQTARDVSPVLQHLGVSPTKDFIEFYRWHQGPFCSQQTGYELADLCITDKPDGSILQPTFILRETMGLPNKLLVISDLFVHAALFYNSESGCVYDVDFEGTHEELLANTLEPTYPSFTDFLLWYFARTD